MSARLGVAVSSRGFAVVLVRGGRVRWRARLDRDGAPVAPMLAALLASAPVKRRARVRVGVSLGVSYCQIKRVAGVSASMRADGAARLVRDNATSFFLRSSSRVVTTSTERGPGGGAWSAALDGGVLDEVIGALRTARFKPFAFLPEPLALALALPPGSHRTIDGGVVAEFSTTKRSTFTAFRRRPVSPAKEDEIASSLDDAAFGAAICPPDRPLAWRPPADPSRALRWQRFRVGSAAAALTISIVASLVAPAVRASRDAAAALRLADRRTVLRLQGEETEGELRRVTASLDRIDRFASKRGDVSLLLGELASVLPDSTALLSVRIDSVEVSLSTLSPRAAGVVASLADAPGVASPAIVGSVMRDASARSLERATIRLRRPRQ